MRVIATMLLSLALAGVAAAQEPPPETPEMTSVLVPVVGTVDGANSVFWRTDLELINDLQSEALVSLVLPTLPDQPALITTVPAQSRIRFNDVFGEAFGIDRGLSPLLVQTLGKRSIGVRAVAYGVRGLERFPPQVLGIAFQPDPVQRVLRGLSFNDEFRSNIGLVNLSSEETTFVLALQRLPGRNLAVTRLTLGPNSLVHAFVKTLFPLISSGEDFSVVVESSAADTYAYASVIENATSTARFVQAAPGAR